MYNLERIGGSFGGTMKVEIKVGLLQNVREELVLSPDLARARNRWRKRFLKMGRYATGPHKWAQEDLNDPAVIEILEQAEEGLSREILDFVLPHIKPVDKMVVVGLGPGRRVSHYLKATNGNCFGIDILPEMVALTHQEIIKSGYEGNLSNFKEGHAGDLKDFQSGSLDLVMWERVGLHILNNVGWELALEEVVGALKTLGLFFLAEPVKELNPRRKPSKDSVYRNFGKYLAFFKERHFKMLKAMETSFAGDSYIMTLFQKTRGSLSL